MYMINITAAKQWYLLSANNSNMQLPASIDMNCPFCLLITNIRLEPKAYDLNLSTYSASGKCPRCDQFVKFWIINPPRSDEPPETSQCAIGVYPNSNTRKTIVEKGILDDRVFRAYKGAIDAFNAGLWTPAVASYRRTLEGITKTMLPEEERKGTLANQLKKLPEHVDLNEPILELAGMLREGGNIGAHFDNEKEPDKDFAEAMLDLLEYFIEYLYIFKLKAQDLETRISSLGDSKE